MKISHLAVRISLLAAALPATAANWPGWRGSDGAGVSSEKNLPLKWGATDNVRWHIDLPERGNSSPIVWGDRLLNSPARFEKPGYEEHSSVFRLAIQIHELSLFDRQRDRDLCFFKPAASVAASFPFIWCDLAVFIDVEREKRDRTG